MRIARSLVVFALMFASAGPAWCADLAPNVAVAKRVLLERMAQGKYDETNGLYDPHFVQHGSNEDANLQQDMQSGRAWRAAFPDLKVAINRTVAQGDLVALHWHTTGTNTVAANGMPGEGRKIDVQGMSFFRFSNGRIIEEWSLFDVANMMTQLGQ